MCALISILGCAVRWDQWPLLPFGIAATIGGPACAGWLIRNLFVPRSGYIGSESVAVRLRIATGVSAAATLFWLAA